MAEQVDLQLCICRCASFPILPRPHYCKYACQIPPRECRRSNPDQATIKCMAGGHDIRLLSNPVVFKPTLTTLLLTENVLSAGLDMRTVLDLGCGSRPIAIGLALSGATHVYATDLMSEACELAIENVKLNRVAERVTVLCGDLFEPVKRMKFDIIVDDVRGGGRGCKNLLLVSARSALGRPRRCRPHDRDARKVSATP